METTLRKSAYQLAPSCAAREIKLTLKHVVRCLCMCRYALQRISDTELGPRCHFSGEQSGFLSLLKVGSEPELVDDMPEVVMIRVFQIRHLQSARALGGGRQTYQFLDLHHIVLERFARAEVQVPNDLRISIRSTPEMETHLVDFHPTADSASLHILLFHPVCPTFLHALKSEMASHVSDPHTCSMPLGLSKDHPFRTYDSRTSSQVLQHPLSGG